MSNLAAEMAKAFGSVQTKPQSAKFFSTGYPPLDKIISGSYQGGIPQGQLCEIHGVSGSGKTFLATEIMKSAQAQGGCAMFVDFERRFKIEFAERRGLKTTMPEFVYTSPPTWEAGNAAAIRFAEMIRTSGEYDADTPIVCVVDSVAAAIPESVLLDKNKSGDAAQDRAKQLAFNMSDNTALSRATSSTLKVVAHYAKELNLTMVYLNQVRTKIGVVYGDPTSVPGGSSLEFYCDVRLQLTKSMEKDGKDVIGQNVTAKTVKNAVTRPLQTVSWFLSFEDDGATVLDREASLIEYLVDNGKIESPTKGYYTWPAGSGNKVRKKALVEAIRQSQTGYQQLLDLLN